MVRATIALAVSTLVLIAPSMALAQTAAAAQSTRETGPALALADLERMALENNPTLSQASAEIEAAKGRAKQAGSLPNPTVGYSADEVSRGPVIRGGEHGIFAEQTIPLGGKLGLSRRVFEREATQAEALRDVQRQKILNDVRGLYYSALAAERRVQIRQSLVDLAAEAVGVSRQLYNTGAADQTDVLGSEIEARETQLALESARNDRFRIWRRLAAFVGDPSLAPRPLAGSIDAPIPELQREVLLQQVLGDSPEVKAARAAVQRAEAALTRARREPAPDLVLRGGPRYNRERLELNGQPVGWEAAFDIGLTIPVFNRNQGAVAESRAELDRARKDVTRLELSLQSRLADAFDEYLTNLRRAEAYKVDIVPRAEQSYRLYLARYREMAAAYPQVLVAQRTLFQVSEQYVTSAEMAWMASLRLQGLLVDGGLDAPTRVGDAMGAAGPGNGTKRAAGGTPPARQ